jgi:hypothetical protein
MDLKVASTIGFERANQAMPQQRIVLVGRDDEDAIEPPTWPARSACATSPATSSAA